MLLAVVWLVLVAAAVDCLRFDLGVVLAEVVTAAVAVAAAVAAVAAAVVDVAAAAVVAAAAAAVD